MMRNIQIGNAQGSIARVGKLQREGQVLPQLIPILHLVVERSSGQGLQNFPMECEHPCTKGGYIVRLGHMSSGLNTSESPHICCRVELPIRHINEHDGVAEDVVSQLIQHIRSPFDVIVYHDHDFARALLPLLEQKVPVRSDERPSAHLPVKALGLVSPRGECMCLMYTTMSRCG
jgi:hypothetical protein